MSAAIELSAETLETIGSYVKRNFRGWFEETVRRDYSSRDIDLIERTVRVEEELRAQRELMLRGFEQVDKRFVQVEKRFEQVDKRFEQVEKRFEQIDKRFEQVEKRFEQVDKRFEQIDKRFEQVDKRFEQVDKRFEDLHRQISRSTMLISFFVALLAAGGILTNLFR
jgi:septal ring factor EnvC (AmiA/AmiB activator)